MTGENITTMTDHGMTQKGDNMTFTGQEESPTMDGKILGTGEMNMKGTHHLEDIWVTDLEERHQTKET